MKPRWMHPHFLLSFALLAHTLTAQEARQVEREFKMLTSERIEAMPQPQREAWQQYLLTSRRHATHEHEVLAADCAKLGITEAKAAPAAKAEFEMDRSVSAEWYGSPEARKTADSVLSYQTPTGGWSKAVDYAAGPRAPGTQWTNNAGNPWHYCGTLDNRSTTEQIKFLANVFIATQSEEAKAGALRGIEWLLAAQFPNGGWPQNYPIERGYHEAITLNDGAMLHAMEVLLSVGKGEIPFTFVDTPTRQRALAAVERGITCLIACQVKIDGKPTVWCAQHDPISLVPVAARLKEPPSLSGAESADILKFFMRRAIPEVIESIEGGVAWLSAHQIKGMRKTKNAEGKTDYVTDPASKEIYWARFYDVATGAPIFAGAQDGKIYSTFHEMAQHNKVAYDYFSTRPAAIVGKEYEKWKKLVFLAKP